MVVFTCNHCGETLHKPKVEKHYQFTCRNYKSVTCVDCFKDFQNDEYVVHTKCITEDERYAAKGTYKNGIVKKGDVKQESWLEMIRSIVETEKNLKPSIRNLLNTISEYSNVPRKKQKFMNFIKSSSGNRVNMKEVEEVWDIIEKYKAKNSPNNRNNQSATGNKEPEIKETKPENGTLDSKKQAKKRTAQNNVETEDETSKKKKKIQSDETVHENSQISSETSKEKTKKQNLEPFQGTKQVFMEENGNTVSKKLKKSKRKALDAGLENSASSEMGEDGSQATEFHFKDKILEILKEKRSISHKKLQKKIFKAYVGFTGQSADEEKIIKKFNKKLKKLPNVGLEDDRVILMTN